MAEIRGEFTDQSNPAIVEVAEVLDVDTDMVMAMMETESHVHVLYSPDPEKPEHVFGVLLRRDSDNILFQATSPVEVPNPIDEVRRRMEEEKE